jgi:hypothetical protein
MTMKIQLYHSLINSKTIKILLKTEEIIVILNLRECKRRLIKLLIFWKKNKIEIYKEMIFYYNYKHRSNRFKNFKVNIFEFV